MQQYIIIREYRENDKVKCDDIIQEGILSNLPSAFWAAITREITFQLIILTSAMMFIFLGVPFALCVTSVPLVIFAIYASMYVAHLTKALEIKQGPPSKYRWVAEAYEPYFFSQNTKPMAYTIITENEAKFKEIDSGSFRRKIVGTVAVDLHQRRHYSGWLHKLAVEKNYRRKGIGSALICSAIRFCESDRFEALECATTECQQPARQLLLNSGFQLMQMYHKKMAFASVEKYHMGMVLIPTL